MVYLVAGVAALSTMGFLLIALGLGYEFAHASGRWQRPVSAIAIAFVVLLGVGGGVLGATSYKRLSAVAVVTVPDRSEIGVPQTSVYQLAQDGWLHFESDSGDFIGGGAKKVWTNVESNLNSRGTKHDIEALVSGQGDMWNLEFRAPSNGELRTGMFDNAERAPFVTGKAPGLEIGGDGRGCNTLSGRFEIKTLTWTSLGTVAEIDVLFEQHCEKGPSSLRGELWYTTETNVHRTPPDAGSSITL